MLSWETRHVLGIRYYVLEDKFVPGRAGGGREGPGRAGGGREGPGRTGGGRSAGRAGGCLARGRPRGVRGPIY